MKVEALTPDGKIVDIIESFHGQHFCSDGVAYYVGELKIIRIGTVRV